MQEIYGSFEKIHRCFEEIYGSPSLLIHSDLCIVHLYQVARLNHCITLQHTATHCNTLQHTATHCNTLQHTAAHMCIVHLYQVARMNHCITLLHTAAHCNTPRHNASHYGTRYYTLNDRVHSPGLCSPRILIHCELCTVYVDYLLVQVGIHPIVVGTVPLYPQPLYCGAVQWHLTGFSREQSSLENRVL